MARMPKDDIEALHEALDLLEKTEAVLHPVQLNRYPGQRGVVTEQQAALVRLRHEIQSALGQVIVAETRRERSAAAGLAAETV